MTNLNGLRICVAGAGALGAATALHLQQRGAAVTLCDPAGAADNASGVAAGMLAPALEAVVDGSSGGGFPLLSQARDLWPGFAAAFGYEHALVRCGSLWLGEGAAAGRLSAIGAEARTVAKAEALALAPGLARIDEAVFTPDDWRLEPRVMLEAMLAAFLQAGGVRLARAVTTVDAKVAVLDDGSRVAADWTILATGQPPSGRAALAPELARLTPIKGQVLRFAAGVSPATGPIVRAARVYVAPAAGGPAVGATMEVGVNDRRPDPETTRRLRAEAVALFPALEAAGAEALAGVRAATPDGLPLLGLSATPGVILVTGARRNGWLLAPLLAQMAGRIAGGEAVGPWAVAFDPARLNAPA